MRKRIISVCVTLCLLLSLVPFSAFADNSRPQYSKVGDIITFGSYPQFKVTDTKTIAALETASAAVEWRSYGYYSGSGEHDDGEMKPGDFMLYKDFAMSGEKYRAVSFHEYRPGFTGGLKEKVYSN